MSSTAFSVERSWLFLVSFLCLCALLASCAAKTPMHPSAKVVPDDSQSALRAELDSHFDDPNLQDAFWGVKIQSVENGEVIYQRNPAKLFRPASNQKLIVAAVALDWLGPEYRFWTYVYADGPIEDGHLKGNLVVVGGGDPTISGRLHEGDPLHVFRGWADQLQQSGVQVIDGDVIGVDDAFDDERLGHGWAWEDLRSGSQYTVEVSGLQFNDNLVDVVIQPGRKAGAEVAIDLDPPTDYVRVDNQLRSVNGGTTIRVVRELEGNRFRVSGTVKAGSGTIHRPVAVFNPTGFTVQVLKEVLEDEGIEVTGEAVDADESASAGAAAKTVQQDGELLLTRESPSLSDILRIFLKTSESLYGETLLKTLGYQSFGIGSREAGVWAIQKALSEYGVPADSYVMVDGAGTSSYNLTSPEAIIRILRQVYRQPDFQDFYDALPIAGVDGTIKDRMQGSAAADNVRAKTGTLAGVRALSGYVTTADGEMLAFAMIANNFNTPISTVEYVQDLVCERLAHLERNAPR